MKLSQRTAAQLGLGAASVVLLASVFVLMPPSARQRIDVKSLPTQPPNPTLSVVSHDAQPEISTATNTPFR